MRPSMAIHDEIGDIGGVREADIVRQMRDLKHRQDFKLRVQFPLQRG